MSPSWSERCEPSCIERSPVVTGTSSTARSSQGATPTTRAGTSVRPTLTLNVSPSLTTCAFVTIRPRFAFHTQPEPLPFGWPSRCGTTSTVDGSAAATASCTRLPPPSSTKPTSPAMPASATPSAASVSRRVRFSSGAMTRRWIAESARSVRMNELLRSARMTCDSVARAGAGASVAAFGASPRSTADTPMRVERASSSPPSTTMTVSPICSWSPPRTIACSMRSPLT